LFKAFIEMRSDLPAQAGTIDTSLIRDAQTEIERLNKERDRVEKEISKLSSEEKNSEAEYTHFRKKIEAEKETNREAEKKLFQSMAEEKTLLSDLQAGRAREESLTLIENDFKRDLGEIAVLIGRDVLQFESMQITSEEPRDKQAERRHQIEKIKIRLED